MTFAQKRPSDLPLLPPVVTTVIVIAALYFGEAIFIPFALALLMSFLLTPPVTWLEKLKIGRVLSVVFVIVVAFSAIGGLLWIGSEQLSAIVIRLPEYQTNIRRRLDLFYHPGRSGLGKVTASIDQIKAQLSENKNTASPQRPQTSQPVPVKIVKPDGLFASSDLVSTSVVHFLGEGSAVVILTLFILIKRGHLRDRLFRLFGQGHLATMTTALDDAARRVSRYLLIQSLINSIYGSLLGLGLYCIGVPYAPFWGVLAAVLRFIPYAGTAIAGLCPFLLSLAVFPGWTRPLLTLGFFAAIEGIATGVIEPWLYAVRTGISSLAILLSAAFWTLLWGPIGLVLSTPLTVCLAVLGRHTPQFEFLYVLLGDEPVLAPEVRFYQRLLALDEEEAAEVAGAYLKEKKKLAEVYDSLLIPALGLAERDRHQGRLNAEQDSFILQATRELVEELSERSALYSPADEATRLPPHSRLSIACFPAKDEADELVGLMLAHLLRKDGYHVNAISVGTAEGAPAQSLEPRDAIVISALQPFAILHARTVCRRVRQECPGIRIVLGLWNSPISGETIRERLGAVHSDIIVTTLEEARLQLASLATDAPTKTRQISVPTGALHP